MPQPGFQAGIGCRSRSGDKVAGARVHLDPFTLGKVFGDLDDQARFDGCWFGPLGGGIPFDTRVTLRHQQFDGGWQLNPNALVVVDQSQHALEFFRDVSGFIFNVCKRHGVLVEIGLVQQVHIGRVNIHELDATFAEICCFERFATFERDVGLLLRDEIATSEFVQRGSAARGRGLHIDGFDQHRRTVVVDDRTVFDFFCLHGVNLREVVMQCGECTVGGMGLGFPTLSKE